ncbi:MAG: hypothetical protein II919_08630 [Lachnospiraceae bacterium]|nr:hypothetical protein [Lachnospiraceae bacterium]
MSYKIAIASTDEKWIDESFGSAKRFLIYEMTEDGYHKLEERIVNPGSNYSAQSGCKSDSGCESDSGCGTGSGCGGNQAASEKVLLVSDCRCIVCKKIGFNVRKQLERKAISSFDVELSIDEALEKISFYYSKIDKHQSLRGLRKE